MTYDEAVAFLSGRRGDGSRDRTGLRALLVRLGNPERAFAAVHVAGTNGKGSTVAYLESIFRAAGRKTGAYFSPHVFDIRERWLLGGHPISTESFTEGVGKLMAVGADGLSEFERKTALAFERFAAEGVEIAIIEAGIGGRDDATSTLPPPKIAVITNVGRDHEAILGSTLDQIAAHKAGVLQPGTGWALTAALGPARTVIEARARAVGVPLRAVRAADLPESVAPGLFGAHQRVNAALAWAATADLPESVRRRGIESTRLPGRFQRIEREGKTLILDVAHNEDGARALAAALESELHGRSLRVVLGVSRGHEPEALLAALAPFSPSLLACEPPFRPRPAAEVAAAARALGLPVVEAPVAAEAIQRAWNEAQAGEVVLVCGSFYVVGETPPALCDGSGQSSRSSLRTEK
jgi:dihydrofolate synthase/folylpolyglutamate synthase